MMPIRQIISCYVALCLAFAGAIGFSPLLHQLIEHGGHGPAHVHVGILTQNASVDGSHVHDSSHQRSHGAGGHTHSIGTGGIFSHGFEPFTFPKPSHLWQALAHLFARDVPDAPAQDGPGHEHHSLAQMLAGGLIEQHLDVPSLDSVRDFSVIHFFPAEILFLDCSFDAQTASRGPPAAQS